MLPTCTALLYYNLGFVVRYDAVFMFVKYKFHRTTRTLSTVFLYYYSHFSKMYIPCIKIVFYCRTQHLESIHTNISCIISHPTYLYCLSCLIPYPYLQSKLKKHKQQAGHNTLYTKINRAT
jgi:hypothetical protein